MATEAKETSNLLGSNLAMAAIAQGASMIKSKAEVSIQKDHTEGPTTYRLLALLGGIAMILSNGIAILDRFFSFRFTSALIAFYNCIFGIFIVSIEAPGVLSVDLAAKVRYYAKFLEYTWGRGILYIFCGSLQVTNVNMLDWCVGGWMILVGITAIIVGMSTQKQLRLLKLSIKSEEDLKQKWNQYDTSGSGSLDVKELTAFVRGEGIEMSSNEVAATFMALDKNFDDRITFEEFQAWWMNTDATNGRAISV
jgi:EF-hand domain pair/COPI associated protein